MTDFVVPIWEVVPRPELTATERTLLAQRHVAQSEIFLDEEDEPVAIVPRCAMCREPWGDMGCSTRRALAVLAIAEHERDELRTKSSAAVRRLEELAVIPNWWKDPHVMQVRASVVIDALALSITGPEMAYHALAQMAREIVASSPSLQSRASRKAPFRNSLPARVPP